MANDINARSAWVGASLGLKVQAQESTSEQLRRTSATIVGISSPTVFLLFPRLLDPFGLGPARRRGTARPQYIVVGRGARRQAGRPCLSLTHTFLV